MAGCGEEMFVHDWILMEDRTVKCGNLLMEKSDERFKQAISDRLSGEYKNKPKIKLCEVSNE